MIQNKESTFEIIDKKIHIPINIATFSVQGDSNSRILLFKSKRFIDGIDVSNKDIYICFKNAALGTGETKTIDVDIDISYIYFKWTVPSECTVQQGDISFYVEFRDTDELLNKKYIYRTMPISQKVIGNFDVYDDATAKDYIVEDDFLELNKAHFQFPELADDRMPILIKDRDILLKRNYTIAVSGDNMSQILSFRVKRVVNGIDRSNYMFYFAYKRADGKTGIAKGANVMVYPNTDEIIVSWALDDRVTYMDGLIQFFLAITGNKSEDGTRYRWRTKNASFMVEKSLDIKSNLPAPSTEWYEELMTEIDNLTKNNLDYYIQNKAFYENIKQWNTEIKSNIEHCFSMLSDVTQCYVIRQDKDINGVFKTISYYRSDNTLSLKSELIPVDNTTHYISRKETRYDVDGTTVLSNTTTPILYDEDNTIIGQIPILSQFSYHGIFNGGD